MLVDLESELFRTIWWTDRGFSKNLATILRENQQTWKVDAKMMIGHFNIQSTGESDASVEDQMFLAFFTQTEVLIEVGLEARP